MEREEFVSVREAEKEGREEAVEKKGKQGEGREQGEREGLSVERERRN